MTIRWIILALAAALLVAAPLQASATQRDRLESSVYSVTHY
jgi:hypothetical protein